MTRPPFNRDSDNLPESADPIIRELEAYTALSAGELPRDLADRVMAAVAEEPTPRRGFLAWLLASLQGGRGAGMTRAVLVAGTMALAVLAVVLAGQLANLLQDQQIGPSPSPSVLTTESPSPSPTESPSARPSRTSRPSPSDDAEASESPDDDERETPEPTGSDNSGPGGGGDGDNSGPGSDSSGSGSGSGDNSGPGSDSSGSGSGGEDSSG